MCSFLSFSFCSYFIVNAQSRIQMQKRINLVVFNIDESIKN